MSRAHRIGTTLAVALVFLLGAASLSSRLFSATPAQASSISTSFYIAGVENGPNVSTTVRTLNMSGSDLGVDVYLYRRDGVLLAHCVTRILNFATQDWCITPSDFGAETVAGLRILSEGPIAVDAYVTKIVGDRKNPQVIERALNPNSHPYQIG